METFPSSLAYIVAARVWDFCGLKSACPKSVKWVALIIPFYFMLFEKHGLSKLDISNC
jgi:hypothetical protein